MDPYRIPPSTPQWPGQPAYPGWPGQPDQGDPGGYRGHPNPYSGSQSLAPPPGYGWNAVAPPDQSPRLGYGGPGGYPPPTGPGPERTKRTASGRRKAWAILAIAALAAAVFGGASYVVLHHVLVVRGQAAGSTSGQGGSRSPASRSASPAATHPGDLRKYLIAAPRGSQPWPKPLGTARKLSLRQVAHLSTNVKARHARLIEDHFVQGAVQCWIAKSGAWIDVRLYQFGSAALAQSFVHVDIGASSRTTPAADQSAVENVPGARAFADAKPDSEGFLTVLVIGIKGDVVFLVDMAEHANTARLGAPDRLMRAQYSKL
jgi:hypothetical protein